MSNENELESVSSEPKSIFDEPSCTTCRGGGNTVLEKYLVGMIFLVSIFSGFIPCHI